MSDNTDPKTPLFIVYVITVNRCYTEFGTKMHKGKDEVHLSCVYVWCAKMKHKTIVS